MDTEKLLNATSDEERNAIIKEYVATATTEDIIKTLADLTLSVDAQQELLLNIASMFTLALTDTMVQSGMITDPDFNEKYLANLDKNWDNLQSL